MHFYLLIPTKPVVKSPHKPLKIFLLCNNNSYMWTWGTCGSPLPWNMISHTNWSLGHSLLICDQYCYSLQNRHYLFAFFRQAKASTRQAWRRTIFFAYINNIMVLAKLHHFQCNLPFFMVGHHLTFATFSW